MYQPKMELTDYQRGLLEGKEGEVVSKMMEVIVRYGDAFSAKRLAKITHGKGHFVTSFGINLITPLYPMMKEIIDDGLYIKDGFTLDPRPMDYKNVKASLLEQLVSKYFIYGKQKEYEELLSKIGLSDEDKENFSCTCYLKQVGNIPKEGDILSWAESSAVVYANSVLGARCNRNSGIIEMFQSILGFVPEFGFLTDDGRKATWKVVLKTSSLPPAQILGSAIGMKVLSDVPYVVGLDKYLPLLPDEETIAYLKDFGAASASNGSVGLYHIEGITPEARREKENLLVPDYKEYVIDDEEINRVRDSYPVIWKKRDAKPKKAFIGCPHLTYNQLKKYVVWILDELEKAKRKKVCIDTVLLASPGVIKEFSTKERDLYERAVSSSVCISYICPLMFVDNPLSGRKPMITNSNKLRTYSACRYYDDSQLIDIIVGKERCR